MSAEKDKKPYRPSYTGFDEEATRRAQETAERAREVQAGPGESTNEAYVDEGPEEAARRMDTSEADVEEMVERAKDRARKR